MDPDRTCAEADACLDPPCEARGTAESMASPEFCLIKRTTRGKLPNKTMFFNHLLVEVVVDVFEVEEATHLSVLHEAGQLLAVVVERP